MIKHTEMNIFHCYTSGSFYINDKFISVCGLWDREDYLITPTFTPAKAMFLAENEQRKKSDTCF